MNKGGSAIAIVLALVIGIAGGWFVAGSKHATGDGTNTAADFKPHEIAWSSLKLVSSNVTEGFKDVDLSSLSAPQKDLALKLMNNEKCSCGCKSMTVAQCTRDMGDCQKSQLMAKYIVDLVKTGKSEGEITKELWSVLLGNNFARIIDEIKPDTPSEQIIRNIANKTLQPKFSKLADSLKGNPDELYLLMQLSSAMMGREDESMYMAFKPGANQQEMIRGFTQALLAKSPGAAKIVKIDPGDSPFMGPADAPITLVEFSDYQCPFSKKVQATVASLKQAFPGKIKHVFKNYPLPMHKEARLAAQASLAAGEQGKYWEMHDKLFEDPRRLPRQKILAYAKELGLDMKKFEKDIDSEEIKAKVAADMAYAQKVGVGSTPTIYINGHLISGAQNSCVFKEVILAELEK